jgi:transcriptional regulator with XRE-family HTH domain
MNSPSETEAFAKRLRQALHGSGVRASPTVVASEFNLRYWGRSITSHTARNWLLGKAFPTQDKLRVLADWLQVSPDELRFCRTGPAAKVGVALSDQAGMADREMVSRYEGLDVHDRKTVRDVVIALSVAATVKSTL